MLRRLVNYLLPFEQHVALDRAVRVDKRVGTIFEMDEVPIASLRSVPRKINHLRERIIPVLGGLGQDPSLCCSHSPQPALLGQDTSLHGVPTTEENPKRTAHSGYRDTYME